jgi:hypothetical protein
MEPKEVVIDIHRLGRIWLESPGSGERCVLGHVVAAEMGGRVPKKFALPAWQGPLSDGCAHAYPTDLVRYGALSPQQYERLSTITAEKQGTLTAVNDSTAGRNDDLTPKLSTKVALTAMLAPAYVIKWVNGPNKKRAPLFWRMVAALPKSKELLEFLDYAALAGWRCALRSITRRM